jgi:arylsulfatase A-like enzyme
MGPSGALRMGKYKLIEIFETEKIELYNLEDDPEELHNLVEAKPLLAQKMLKHLKSWQKKSGAEMAKSNPNYTKEKDFRKK